MDRTVINNSSLDGIVFSYQMFLLHLPTIIFLGMSMIAGVIGNTLVLYIYISKIRQSNHKIFIVYLAVIDLTVCAIVIPSIMYEQLYPLVQYREWICKIKITISHLMIFSSIFILLIIAFERHRKVCRPLKRQITLKEAKMCCAIAMAISACLSIPIAQIFGLNTVKIKVPGFVGARCSFADTYKNTYYVDMVHALYFLVVFCTFVILSIFYYYIGQRIRRLSTNKYTLGDDDEERQTNLIMNHAGTSTGLLYENKIGRVEQREVSKSRSVDSSKNNKVILKASNEDNTLSNAANNINRRRISLSQFKRTTCMLFTISAVFFLSYIPNICVLIVESSQKDFLLQLGKMEYCIYNLILWSYVINNVANPIIYGFCDKRFITETKWICSCGHTE